MYGVNNFDGEGQGEIHHIVVDKEKLTTWLKKKVVTSEKVTTSEEVDRGTKYLDDIKESAVTISRKDSDNFESKSKGSTGWFNLDYNFLKNFFYT